MFKKHMKVLCLVTVLGLILAGCNSQKDIANNGGKSKEYQFTLAFMQCMI